MDKAGLYGRRTAWIYSWLIDPLLVPLRKRVVKICQRLHLKDVLDIASATGAQCLLLDRAGIHAIGLDLSLAMIVAARRQSPPTVQYVCGSAFAIPFPDGSFDGVLLLLALHEHSEGERVQMLHEAARVLRQDGILILAEYAPPETSKGRLVWGLITFIERLSERKHYSHFRQFVHAGGIRRLEGELSLSVCERHSIYNDTIVVIVAKFADAD